MNKLLIPVRAWVSSPAAAFIDICVCCLAQRPETEGACLCPGLPVAPAHLDGGLFGSPQGHQLVHWLRWGPWG